MRRLGQIKFTEETVRDIKAYITNGVLPPGTDEAQRRFRARCDGFKVSHGHLVYEREPGNFIPVILPDEVEATLERFYKMENTIGKGINQFYFFVSQRVLGITREQVATFLHAQTTYQISFHRRNIPGRAYICTEPLQYWAIDLVDVHYYANSNNNLSFIFTLVDLFSRFVYFVGCRGKFASSTEAAFKSIIQFNHIFAPGDRFPTHVVSDNGAEFQGELGAYFRAHGVEHVTTASYRPQPHVEERNRELRRLLRTTFVKNNNHKWVNELGSIADSMNSNYNSTLKATPEQVMQAFFDGDDLSAIAERANEHVQKKFSSNYAQNHLQVRDRVRVRMSSLFSVLRDREKAETMKKTVVRYTPDIYYIQKVIEPKPTQLGYPVYQIVGPDRKIVRKSPEGPPRTFNASELLLVPPNATAPFSLQRSAVLNRVRYKNPHPVAPAPAAAPLPLPPPPPPPPPPKPPVDWKTKQWGEALVGKEFTSENMRCFVIGVEYRGRYLVEYIESNKVAADGSFPVGETMQQTLRDALQEMRGEPWYIAPYDAVIAKYS